MTQQIEAVYEKGVFRPTQPINFPEGEHLHLIVVTREQAPPNSNASALLAEIAVLPIEGENNSFSGRDTVLYPHK